MLTSSTYLISGKFPSRGLVRNDSGRLDGTKLGCAGWELSLAPEIQELPHLRGAHGGDRHPRPARRTDGSGGLRARAIVFWFPQLRGSETIWLSSKWHVLRLPAHTVAELLGDAGWLIGCRSSQNFLADQRKTNIPHRSPMHTCVQPTWSYHFSPCAKGLQVHGEDQWAC